MDAQNIFDRPFFAGFFANGKTPANASACRPGKHLRILLAKLGIRADVPGCKCMERSTEMDRQGCDWCSENIDTIVGWLREEAGNRALPFLDAAARLLVREAIRRARNETKAAMDKPNG